MGVVSSIIRSSDDDIKPKGKSYWGYGLNVKLIDIEKISKKKYLLPSEQKEVRHELSGKEPVEKVIVVKNSNKKLGRLTTSQVKDLLDDMGFNVDVLVGDNHFSDFDAVLNVGGYSIPGWVWLARMVTKLIPTSEKLLLSKLSPGKDRLHVRIFEQNDNSWVIIAHTDANWLSLNLARVYKAHLQEGEGDYVTGTIMMFNLLKKFSKFLSSNKIFKQKDIDKVIRDSYSESFMAKLKTKTGL